MLDVARVLSPGGGAVTEHNALPPGTHRNPLWSVGAVLACSHRTGGAQVADRPCVTGACSVSRSRATVRTAGEVVERFALHEAPGMRMTPEEVGTDAVDLRRPGAELADPPAHARLLWYAGRRWRDGAERLVPSGLVDFPAQPEDLPGFDPGPSGAAAGIGTDAAVRSALLETVERDAVIVAWARQLRLTTVDLDAAAGGSSDDPWWHEVSRTVEAARAAGLEVVCSQVPTSVEHVVCVVAGLRGTEPRGPRLCLGAKASEHPGRAVLGALEESFQLYFGLDALDAPADPPPVVVTEEDRMRFIASTRGVAALETWLESPDHTSFAGHSAVDVECEQLLRAMRADGADPVLLRLTTRLPEGLRRQGWEVYKVVPVGYQPLRIDERHTFGWHRGRLDDAESRTGAPARLPVGVLSSAPHPLP